jgi:hypothetical protein
LSMRVEAKSAPAKTMAMLISVRSDLFISHLQFVRLGLSLFALLLRSSVEKVAPGFHERNVITDTDKTIPRITAPT